MNNDDKCLCLTHGCSMPSSVLSSSQVNSFDGDQLSGPREIIGNIWVQPFQRSGLRSFIRKRHTVLTFALEFIPGWRRGQTGLPHRLIHPFKKHCHAFSLIVTFKKKQRKALTSHFTKILPNSPRRIRSGPGQSETLGRPLDQGAPRKGHI